MQGKKEKMKLKKWFTHNLGLKIISILLSFFLWMYIYYVFGARTTKEAYIQVQLGEINSSLHVNLNPARIKVRYNGPMQMIESAEKGLKAVLELPEDINPGTYQRKPTLVSPSNIDILEIEPEQIEVTIERMVVKDFKIETNLVGKPENGNIVGEIKLTPSTISVEGSESTIERIKKVMVELDVTNAISDIFGSAEVKILDEQNQLIENAQASENVIQFQIHVFSSDLTKTVPILPKLIGTTSWMITKVMIEPQVVTIQGPSKVLDSITGIETEDIDINYLKGTLDKEITLVIPDQIKNTNPDVKYRIKIVTEEIVTIQLKDIPIQILPANSKKAVTLSENRANLAITGKKSVVESIQQFQLYINIEKLSNGEHTVVIQASQLPKECTFQIFPSKISVKIMD